MRGGGLLSADEFSFKCNMCWTEVSEWCALLRCRHIFCKKKDFSSFFFSKEANVWLREADLWLFSACSELSSSFFSSPFFLLLRNKPPL